MSEITAAIAWNDQLLNHHPEMDATHREFVDHLAQVQAALAGPQDALLARYDAMLEHTVEHFAQEDRWMKDLGFSADNCHSAQHSQVLAVMREVRRQHAEGQSDLIGRLRRDYPGALEARYKLQAADTAAMNDAEMLIAIGRKRGAVLSGGRINLQKAAEIVLHEFRAGLLGRITLELPEEHLALTAAAEQAEAALQAERLEKKRNRRGRSSRDAQPDGDTFGENEVDSDSDSEGGGGEA